MVAFVHLVTKRRERLTSLITARALAADLNPDEVQSETMVGAFRHLKNQVESKPSFEFRGKPEFEGWLMSIAGDHRKKEKGGVIPTLLKKRLRERERIQLVADYDDAPDEHYDETEALLISINLEELFIGVDPTNRCLFEFAKGGLSSAPSADSVVAHARKVGMTSASVDALRHRASLMSWPKRKGRNVTYKELAMLFELDKEDVRKRVRATLLQLRKGLDPTVSPYPHWSVWCGRRKLPATTVY